MSLISKLDQNLRIDGAWHNEMEERHCIGLKAKAQLQRVRNDGLMKQEERQQGAFQSQYLDKEWLYGPAPLHQVGFQRLIQPAIYEHPLDPDMHDVPRFVYSLSSVTFVQFWGAKRVSALSFPTHQSPFYRTDKYER